MIIFAYTECGLSIERFFQLSWYEWSLEVEKVTIRNKKRHEEWEGHASLTREFMALMAEINRNPKKRATPFKGSEFIKLSFDKDEEEIEKQGSKLTPEQVEKMHPKKLPKLKKIGE